MQRMCFTMLLSSFSKILFGIGFLRQHLFITAFFVIMPDGFFWNPYHYHDASPSLQVQLTLFHVSPTEYRRRFRDWGVVKRMTKKDRDAVTSALVKRKRPGASVSDVTTQRNGGENPLDYKNLKRHLKGKKPQRLEVAPGLYVLYLPGDELKS